jgi:hypothetical protein
MLSSKIHEERKQISLEEVLSPENIILVDGSAETNVPGQDGIAKQLCHVRSYPDLERIDLDGFTCRVNRLRNILLNSQTYTIRGVSDGITSLVQFIGKKYHEFLVQGLGEDRDPENSAMSKLQNAHERSFQLLQVSKRKDIEREIQFTAEYDRLVDMVKVIDRALGLKRDRQTTRVNPIPKDTDERLTAALFYLSKYSDKKPTIITSDTDFIRLVGVVPPLLVAPDFLPYNQTFSDRIMANPPSIYLSTLGKYEHAVLTRDLDPSRPFYLRSGREPSDTVRVRILQLWKDLDAASNRDK